MRCVICVLFWMWVEDWALTKLKLTRTIYIYRQVHRFTHACMHTWTEDRPYKGRIFTHICGNTGELNMVMLFFSLWCISLWAELVGKWRDFLRHRRINTEEKDARRRPGAPNQNLFSRQKSTWRNSDPGVFFKGCVSRNIGINKSLGITNQPSMDKPGSSELS